MSELLFDSEKHDYTINGAKIMSVSEFIAPLASGKLDEIDEITLATAAERGVVCHGLIEMLMNGEDIEYPEEYEPHVEAIELFLSEHDITPIYTETPFYSERLSLAGTPDSLCLFDGVQAIIDYKFVSSIDKTKVKAQLNCYRAILEDNEIYAEKMYAVQFLPENYRLYPVAADSTEIDCLLGLRQLKNQKHKKGAIGL